MNVNPLSTLFPSLVSPTNSTANAVNANSASSVQQQADVLSLPPAEQFLSQLQQVQTPQQYQAMLSQMTGQPVPTNTTASSGAAPPTAKHCQGGAAHHAASPLQNQSLLASILGSINPSQSAVL
jgi:hypothetical protein